MQKKRGLSPLFSHVARKEHFVIWAVLVLAPAVPPFEILRLLARCKCNVSADSFFHAFAIDLSLVLLVVEGTKCCNTLIMFHKNSFRGSRLHPQAVCLAGNIYAVYTISLRLGLYQPTYLPLLNMYRLPNMQRYTVFLSSQLLFSIRILLSFHVDRCTHRADGSA